MLDVDIRPIRGVLFVRLKGCLDKSNVNKVEDVMYFQEKVGIKNIVFNIAELDSIDLYGENALLSSLNLCSLNDGQSFICSGDNLMLRGLFSGVCFVDDELAVIKLLNL